MRKPAVIETEISAKAGYGRYSTSMVKKTVYTSGIKRLLDLTLVLVTLPLSFFVVLVLAVIVSFDGGSPFFTQQRVGRNGRVFRMMKLRTMRANAEQNLSAYLSTSPEAAAEWSRTQKLRDDPRVTRFGKILRKSSLDELPQLINVLLGDMSLVGPRPMLEDQQYLYTGQAYFELRPGVTGPWQVSARNTSEFAARAGFDDEYGRTVSFTGDLKILIQTLSAVLRRTGH